MIEMLGLPAASTFASDIDRVFTIIFFAVGFWFVLAQGVFFWLIFRFKKRDGVKAQYITGELKSEKRWITVPHNIILLFDIVIVVAAVQVWYKVKQDLPESPTKQEVRVIGQQWAWTFVHPGPDGKLDTPDDIAKVGELHVQNDQLYHFHLESKDVIHSFSVPVFRLKQDVIPGRVITGWFTPTKTGTYDIQCTEICGIGHALMPAKIFIETPAEHAEWIAKNSSSAVASAALR